MNTPSRSCRHGRGAHDLLAGLGVFCALPGHGDSANPAHGSDEPHELFDTPFYNRFRNTVDWCVKHRWITIGLTIGTLLLGLAGMGRVQQQFFPDSSRLDLLVDLWYPEVHVAGRQRRGDKARGSPRDEARRRGQRDTWLGSGLPRFALVHDQIFPQTNVSQLVIAPKDLAARERLRRELPAILATEFPEARGRAKLLPTAHRWRIRCSSAWSGLTCRGAPLGR